MFVQRETNSLCVSFRARFLRDESWLDLSDIAFHERVAMPREGFLFDWKYSMKEASSSIFCIRKNENEVCFGGFTYDLELRTNDIFHRR